MTNNKQQTHTCVFEKSKTSNSNEAKCKYCNIVRYTIDVKLDHNAIYGGGEQWATINKVLLSNYWIISILWSNLFFKLGHNIYNHERILCLYPS